MPTCTVMTTDGAYLYYDPLYTFYSAINDG